MGKVKKEDIFLGGCYRYADGRLVTLQHPIPDNIENPEDLFMIQFHEPPQTSQGCDYRLLERVDINSTNFEAIHIGLIDPEHNGFVIEKRCDEWFVTYQGEETNVQYMDEIQKLFYNYFKKYLFIKAIR